MAVTFSFGRISPVAFWILATAHLNAAPIPCSTIGGSPLSAVATNGSCSIGDLVFSDFAFQFSPTAGSPPAPNPSRGVTAAFNERTGGVTPDPFRTVGTSTKPLVNFTGGNIVGENQSERYVLRYLVRDTDSGTQAVQVDNNIAGGAAVNAGASGGLTVKSMGDGGPFGSNVGAPTGTRPAGNVRAAVAPSGGSMFIDNPDSEVDSSILYNRGSGFQPYDA